MVDTVRPSPANFRDVGTVLYATCGLKMSTTRECTRPPASHRNVGAAPRHGRRRGTESSAGEEEPSKPGAFSLQAVYGDSSRRRRGEDVLPTPAI